jgi:hypothetical protein
MFITTGSIGIGRLAAMAITERTVAITERPEAITERKSSVIRKVSAKWLGAVTMEAEGPTLRRRTARSRRYKTKFFGLFSLVRVFSANCFREHGNAVSSLGVLHVFRI